MSNVDSNKLYESEQILQEMCLEPFSVEHVQESYTHIVGLTNRIVVKISSKIPQKFFIFVCTREPHEDFYADRWSACIHYEDVCGSVSVPYKKMFGTLKEQIKSVKEDLKELF